MNLLSVVTQIQTYCTPLGSRVSGAADFATGLETVVNMPLPAAFVLPLEDDAQDNEALNGLRQFVTERIGVVLQFDNTVSSDADARTGFAGIGQVYAMRTALFAAILNWLPPGAMAPRGLAYGGGRMLTFDRARLFWQFEFTLETQITDSDGWQSTSVPLLEIDVTEAEPAGTPAAIVQILLPQS